MLIFTYVYTSVSLCISRVVYSLCIDQTSRRHEKDKQLRKQAEEWHMKSQGEDNIATTTRTITCLQSDLEAERVVRRQSITRLQSEVAAERVRRLTLEGN